MRSRTASVRISRGSAPAAGGSMEASRERSRGGLHERAMSDARAPPAATATNSSQPCRAAIGRDASDASEEAVPAAVRRIIRRAAVRLVGELPCAAS
eukprot:scaffold15878_cov137-Isochrysis_galbana.AAC.3